MVNQPKPMFNYYSFVFGQICCLGAIALFLIPSITSPVVKNISMASIDLRNSSTLNLGIWGYCVLNTATNGDLCTPTQSYFQPANIVAAIDSSFPPELLQSLNSQPRINVLHPIVCGFTFLIYLRFPGPLLAPRGMIINLIGLVTPILGCLLLNDVGNYGKIVKQVQNGSLGRASFCCIFGWVMLIFALISLLIWRRQARRDLRMMEVMERWEEEKLEKAAAEAAKKKAEEEAATKKAEEEAKQQKALKAQTDLRVTERPVSPSAVYFQEPHAR